MNRRGFLGSMCAFLGCALSADEPKAQRLGEYQFADVVWTVRRGKDVGDNYKRAPKWMKDSFADRSFPKDLMVMPFDLDCFECYDPERNAVYFLHSRGLCAYRHGIWTDVRWGNSLPGECIVDHEFKTRIKI